MMAQPTSRTTLAEGRDVGLRDIARDGVELVERAAGMAEAAARDHRHEAAAGRDRRRERAGSQCRRRRRSNACRGPGRAGPRSAPRRNRVMARVSATRSGDRHAAEEHRHGEGRGLSLGDAAVGQPGDEDRRSRLASSAPPSRLRADDLLRQPSSSRLRGRRPCLAPRSRRPARRRARSRRCGRSSGVAQPGPMMPSARAR